MAKFIRTISDFSGGLSEVANDNIPDNCIKTARNVVSGDGYGIARANGTTIAFEKVPSSDPVVMLTELAIDETTHIIAATGTNVKWNLWDWDGNVWRVVVDAEQNANIAPMLSWFVYAGKLFWLDGTNYRYYDGAIIADVENPEGQEPGLWTKIKTSRAVVQRSTRWFFATDDNEVLISEVGRYDKVLPTGIINITTGVNDTITALHEFNEGVLVFQQRSVFYLTGWDLENGSDVKLAKLSVESGTRWPRSVKTISNAVLYLGDNGVYRLSIPYFTSSIAATNISDKQASSRLTVPANDVYAEVHNGIYYITLQGAGGIMEYRYYTSSKSWWGEYTQQPYCYAARLGGSDKLFLGCENGYVLYYDEASTHYVSTVDGGPMGISIEVKTKSYDVVGRMVVDSKVKRVFVVLRQSVAERSSLSVQVKADYAERAWNIEGDESLVWEEGNWAEANWGWIDTVTKMAQLNKKCKRVQFIFRDNEGRAAEPLLIYGVAMQFKKKKVKGSRRGVAETDVQYDD